MTTPDYPDWQQPVSIVDRATVLGGGPINLASGLFQPFLDTSSANSLSINVTTPNSPAVGTRNALFLEWSEAGIVVSSDKLTYHSNNSYAYGSGGVTWQVPVRGSAVRLRNVASDLAFVVVSVIASTRSLAGDRQTITAGDPTRVLLDQSLGVIAAGATSATVYVPPVASEATVRLNQKLATMSVLARAISGVPVLGITSVVTILGTDPTNAGLSIPVPGQAMELSVTNNDTVGHTTTLAVMDASY